MLMHVEGNLMKKIYNHCWKRKSKDEIQWEMKVCKRREQEQTFLINEGEEKKQLATIKKGGVESGGDYKGQNNVF